MPHRNKAQLEELEKSLEKITEENKSSNIILAGDFNCPDIMWDNLTIRKDAQDPEVQKQLVNITTQFGLTQFTKNQQGKQPTGPCIHNKPVTYENINKHTRYF